MASTATQVVSKAASQLGYYVKPGGVTKFGSWYGIPNGQWCAMFISWVADQVDALDIIPKHAYTPSGVNWFKAKGQWHNGTAGIRRGDIAYFDFPGLPNRVSHVAIVESVNSDGSFNTIEGNTSGTLGGDQRNGGLCARKRRKSYCVGYGRPNYSSTPSGGPRNADGSETLETDGVRGPRHISRWQEVMNTPIDGKISKQSQLITADQKYLNAAVGATHIRNLTGSSKLDPDGDEGAKTIKVRQFWLFNQLAPSVLGRNARTSDFDGIAGEVTNRLHQIALNKATAGSGRY